MGATAPSPTGLTPLARVAFLVGAAWLVLHALHAVLDPSLDLGPVFSRYAHGVLLLVTSGLCIAGGLRRRGTERLAWLLIGAGVLAWSLGEVYYTAVLWTESSPPIPSLADIGYLMFP